MPLLNARQIAEKLICEGCGCTDEAACPGGCHWVSRNPPVCSSCVPGGELPNASALDVELCQASLTPAPHVLIWLGENEAYCARCRDGFAA